MVPTERAADGAGPLRAPPERKRFGGLARRFAARDCIGMQEERPNWDKIGASMNAIRTKSLLEDADVVVVRFGEKYRQWNAAFDAGYAHALEKPIITLHPPSISHMLKEVNASANVVCEEPGQVVDTLAYIIRGDLPTPRDGDAFIPIADRLGKGNPNP